MVASEPHRQVQCKGMMNVRPTAKDEEGEALNFLEMKQMRTDD
jgi:hypothetical protein